MKFQDRSKILLERNGHSCPLREHEKIYELANINAGIAQILKRLI